MVAVIQFGRDLRNSVNYNERKVKEGKAECLLAVNYPKELEDLNVDQKCKRLANLAALNTRTKAPSVHISLNFHPSERLTNERLTAIAAAYMNKIGFSRQPYLVYRHHDSAHPHLHVVATNIGPEGKRIGLTYQQSRTATQELEQDFGLFKAASMAISADKHINADKDIERISLLPPGDIGKVRYGKTETKRSISEVVNKVLAQYKFSSLPELNAILKQYNVMADRGSENSRIFRWGGLLYRVLNEKGIGVSEAIKASSLDHKPTLANLQCRYMENCLAKKPHAQRVRTAIDWEFAGGLSRSMEDIIQALQKENIAVVLSKSKEGQLSGIAYVDHKTKCVFEGSDLGMAYEAKSIQERCTREKCTGNSLLQQVPALKDSLAEDLRTTKTTKTTQTIKTKKQKSIWR